MGLEHTAGLVVRAEGDAHDLISFLRPRDARPYTADDKRFIDRLVPDIARAARLRARMLHLSRNAALGMAALDSLRQGVAVVDSQCRIHHVNAAMERHLAAPGPLCARQGRLACTEREAHARLQQLAAVACASPPQAGALTLAGDVTTQRLALSVLPMQASHAWAALRQVPLALVVAATPGAATNLSQGLVAEILGLSPTEARLALLLASGKTVKEFAAIQGCTWHTARAHLANLLGKTGCRRQVELVQLLQALQVG